MLRRFSNLTEGFSWMRENASGDCTFMTYQGHRFRHVFIYIHHPSEPGIQFSERLGEESERG